MIANNKRLVLGTAQLGFPYGIANKQGHVSLDEAKKIIEYAATKGISTLDTAIAYGNSEQRLGEIGVQNWRVVSKLPAVPDGCGDIHKWVMESVYKSLQRLRVTSLYGLLLHRPKQLLERDGDCIYHSLLFLKARKLVEKIGISIYDPAELHAYMHQYRFDIVQTPFNILDRRLIDTFWLDYLAECGTEVHVRSVFLQGLLLMTPSERPQKFNRFESLWEQWEAWLKRTGFTRMQACLCFALSFKEISKVIVGVDSLIQLKEILQAAECQVPNIPDELQSNDQALLNPARWGLLV